MKHNKSENIVHAAAISLSLLLVFIVAFVLGAALVAIELIIKAAQIALNYLHI